MGRFPCTLAGQSTCRCNPTGMAAHDFQDEYLGGGLTHGLDVQAGFQGGRGHVLGYGTKAGTAVREGQVIVDGLGHANAGDWIAHLFADLGYLECGVLGVTAAIVEEVPDIVGLEHFHQPLVFAAVLGQVLHLVAAGAKGPAGGMHQGADSLIGFFGGVDQLFPESPDNAIAAGVYPANLLGMFAGGFNHAAGTGIDDGGYTAGLGIERILDSHLGLAPPAGWTLGSGSDGGDNPPDCLCRRMIRESAIFFMTVTLTEPDVYGSLEGLR